MQCACAALYCNLWPDWFYHIFPHYLINGRNFGKKIVEHKMRVLIFSTDSVWKFLILRRIQQDAVTNVHRSSCQVFVIPLTLLSHFNQTWTFWTDCRKILKHEISLKSIHWEPNSSMRTEGNTEPDMKKLIVYFLWTPLTTALQVFWLQKDAPV